MFSLIPSDANDPQGLMRRKAPNKQNLHFVCRLLYLFIQSFGRSLSTGEGIIQA